MPKKSSSKPANPSKPAKPTKASFVRSIPSSVPAKEVVAKAKAAGMTLSEKHVYVIRSDAKKRSAKKKAGGASKGHAAAASTSHAPKAVSHSAGGGGGGSNETNFRKLVLALGIPKAKLLVTDVERRLNQLISGH
jgi:hypothetical protein